MLEMESESVKVNHKVIDQGTHMNKHRIKGRITDDDANDVAMGATRPPGLNL
jgi:hypothetical protein